MRFVLLCFVMLFFISCSQKEPIFTKKELPSWYVNPPQNSTSSYFSLGEGRDKQAAILDALNSFAQTLSVGIESEFVMQTQTNGSYLSSQNTKSIISSKVKNINLSSYEVLNIYDLGFERVLCLIKLDKKGLFSAFLSDIEQKLATSRAMIDEAKNYDIANRLKSYKKAKANIDDVEVSIGLEKVLNGEFDALRYQAASRKIVYLYDELKSSITISLHSDKNSQNYLQGLKSAATSDGIVMVEKGSLKNHLDLYVNSSMKKTYSYGFYMANSIISFELKNSSGNIVGANRVEVVSHSPNSYEDAIVGLRIKFDELIKKEGVSKVVGFEF